MAGAVRRYGVACRAVVRAGLALAGLRQGACRGQRENAGGSQKQLLHRDLLEGCSSSSQLSPKKTVPALAQPFAVPGSAILRCCRASTPAGSTFATLDWILFFS